MTKLVYLAAMALLGLGLTMAQSTSTPSDASNSTKASETQNSAVPSAEANAGNLARSIANNTGQQKGAPGATVQRQNSTTSTTGAASLVDNKAITPQNGAPVDQRPNTTLTNPGTPTPHLVTTDAPAGRAMATHTPDPGTCMNPAALETSQTTGAIAQVHPPCD